ncbi:MAG: hypothetical protein PHS14_18305 [Elusimicrobia bacterium]|nr:hypothetical protein [Elusimicrobiota bacterium]
MKGKIWELGPFVLAVLVGLYFVAERLRQASPAPAEISSPGKPLTGAAPRASTGPGDPTKPADFLPDRNPVPDPNSLPDPVVSTAARGAPRKR